MKLLCCIVMDLDDLLRRYFHQADLSAISPDVMASGIAHCHVDLDRERYRGQTRRVMDASAHVRVGPDLDVGFEGAENRKAACNFMDRLEASEGDAEG